MLNAVLTAAVLLLTTVGCGSGLGQDNLVQPALDRSRLLEISHDALRENMRLRRQATDLRGEVVELSEQLLALGDEHSGLLREHVAAIEGQQELLAALQTREEEHSALQTAYDGLREENDEYLSLHEEFKSVYEELAEMKEDFMSSVSEKEELVNFFENYIEKFEAAQEKVTLEMTEAVQAITAEKHETEQRLTIAEQNYRQLFRENQEVTHQLGTARALLQEQERVSVERDVERAKALRERDDLTGRLQRLEDDYRELLHETTKTREDCEARLLEAETTIGSLRRQIVENDERF